MAKRPAKSPTSSASPAKSRQSSATRMLQLHISLRDSHPLIWRRLLIAESENLEYMHKVCQILMHWDNSHPHVFKVSGWQDLVTSPFFGMDDLGDNLHGADVCLSECFIRKSSKLLYYYDFGDSWCCEIKLEARLPILNNDPRPTVLAGEMAPPPDDIGGLYGFYRALDILKDPDDEEYEDYIGFFGDDFDPTACDHAKLTELVRRRGGYSVEGLEKS